MEQFSGQNFKSCRCLEWWSEMLNMHIMFSDKFLTQSAVITDIVSISCSLLTLFFYILSIFFTQCI